MTNVVPLTNAPGINCQLSKSRQRKQHAAIGGALRVKSIIVPAGMWRLGRPKSTTTHDRQPLLAANAASRSTRPPAMQPAKNVPACPSNKQH